MLGRVTPGVFGQLTVAVNLQQSRNMATLKSIQIRLKSVTNIKKITSSMKMVSASKFGRAERELKNARPYGQGAIQFYEKAEIAEPENQDKELYVAMSSDRGLCGGTHTAVVKVVRRRLAEPGAENVKVVCVGDKARSILQRVHGQHILMVVNEIGRLPPSFLDAARLANAIMNSGFEFGSGKIVFNEFKSVVSYVQTSLPMFSRNVVENAPKLAVYDSLDAEILQSYLEFSLASVLYYALKEGACSEQSSRMTAMENASKNAAEMIEKLTLTFNRTRQAVITRELIEIISGAAALE